MAVFGIKSDNEPDLKDVEILIREGRLEEALVLAKKILIKYRQKNLSKLITPINAKIMHIQGLLAFEDSDFEIAANAFDQAVLYYRQSSMMNEYQEISAKLVDILIRLAETNSKENKFERTAEYYDRASKLLRSTNNLIVSLELLAKSYVYRAASVRDPDSRKEYLNYAVKVFTDNQVNHPLYQGHLEYYQAIRDRSESKDVAIDRLNKAINFYSEAGEDDMVEEAKSLKNSVSSNYSKK